MSESEVRAVYFDKPGGEHSTRILELAKQRADDLRIEIILVATTTGATGALAAKHFAGRRVVVVTHATGFREANTQELTEENRAKIEAAGAQVLTCQHALAGIGRAGRKKWGTYGIDDVVAQTLRVFGEGMKVCVEIALMAADAGLVIVGEPCIAIAGTGLVILFVLGLYLGNFGSIRSQDLLLRFSVTPDERGAMIHEKVFSDYLKKHSLLNIQTRREGRMLELSYFVKLRSPERSREFVRALGAVDGIESVSLIAMEETAEA